MSDYENSKLNNKRYQPRRWNKMALGPGKYDDLCTYVREKAKAEGAIVIVYGGERGQGFS